MILRLFNLTSKRLSIEQSSCLASLEEYVRSGTIVQTSSFEHIFAKVLRVYISLKDSQQRSNQWTLRISTLKFPLPQASHWPLTVPSPRAHKSMMRPAPRATSLLKNLSVTHFEKLYRIHWTNHEDVAKVGPPTASPVIWVPSILHIRVPETLAVQGVSPRLAR